MLGVSGVQGFRGFGVHRGLRVWGFRGSGV